jgi:hypothetical protein
MLAFAIIGSDGAEGIGGANLQKMDTT